jgi:hypothetical protein
LFYETLSWSNPYSGGAMNFENIKRWESENMKRWKDENIEI